MAEAPGHKLGQIIGEVLEQSVEPLLRAFADKHHLYLDKKGPRGVRIGNTVTWTDRKGNSHDLDYVLERNGTDGSQGTPVAFIETAWRRYTKHSRNKAQEIQGAIVPLCETFSHVGPFCGAILAGEFTDGALSQLSSLGFTVLYFSYETVLAAFGHVDLDMSFEENTATTALSRKVKAWKRLSPKRQTLVATKLLELNGEEVEEFLTVLERAVTRRIEIVRILPLYGHFAECASVEEAIAFIQRYEERRREAGPLVRYEIQVVYANGDRIEGRFSGKQDAIKFLAPFLPPSDEGKGDV
ncbi:MAG TPA: DNA methylase [Terriglobia bacterium]|nr:DNA methylase [Terriglobia bacterium]